MKNLSITLKVIIYVAILGLSCIFVMGYVSINAADKILSNSARDEIEAVEGLKKHQIEQFFTNKINSIEALSRMPVTIKAISNFNRLVISGKELDYTKNPDLQLYAGSFSTYMKSNGFEDIIVAGTSNGRIMYSNNPYYQNRSLNSETGYLASVWRKCLNSSETVISDMEKSEIKGEKPVMYIGHSIINNGETIAILIGKITTEPIDDIMLTNDGLGETGESYLVGEDFLFRSNSIFITDDVVLEKSVNTDATESVFNGVSGVKLIEDYRGEKVLSAFTKINIDGLNWAIITEIDEREIMAPKRSLINTILWVCAFIAMIMFPVLYFIGQSLRKPLLKEVEFAKKLAAGELQAEIDINQKDEIGILADALRTIASSTKKVIQSVSDAASNLADASFQLSGSSQNLSTGASQQASSIEEVSASMEEMASNIQQNADNAKQTEEITRSVSDQVSQGSDIVLSSVESMEQIADKISIIRDIAFQTNILALNASVEAARAGEYGKGFGVVASEVGKLADKTKAAATEIDEISKASVDIASKTKTLMGELVPSIQNSSTLVQEISAASNEQKDAADQINNAIQILNDVSQRNAASAEEMATNSEELSSQAEQLVSAISHFKITGMARQRKRNYENSPKLITEKNNVPEKDTFDDQGIDIDLSSNDNIDNEFERF